MISKLRKHFFKFSVLCGVVALILLVAAVTSTSWVIIRTTDEITLPENITQKFPNFHVNKLDLEIMYSFGLLSFCVTTHDIELKTTKKECHSIGVFKQDLEKAALQDAMKFQVLAIVFLMMSLGAVVVTKKINEGHIKAVLSYIAMAFMFFSGTSAVSSLSMVTNTLTEHSSIVAYNVLAHRGVSSEIDLEGITTGASYDIAVAGIILIVFALLLFIGDYKMEKDQSDIEDDGRNNYRLLPITRESILGYNDEEDA